jgi:phenylacetic acid degradation operon negative regulatory protein
MRPTAKSLVLDLLSTVRQGAMPARALVAAGALFGIDANAIRVALARLLAARTVARDARGRYRLGEASGAVGRQIARWRTIEDALGAWDGTWVGVLGVSGRGRAARPSARALRFLAFRALAPAVHVRPNNLAGDVGAVREQLAALGLSPAALVARLDAFDVQTEARARALWDVARLRAEYRAARAALARSAKRLRRLAPERAMTESFLLGGRVIRQLVLDPLLPEPLVPAAERRALVAAMCDYDRLGRACWRPFMRAFAVVPGTRAPADLRIVDGDGGWEGAVA